MSNRGINPRLGLLPERKLDWRTLVASYGVEAVIVLLLINVGLLMPEKIKLVQYHVVPLVALKPYEPPKPPQMKPHVAKLLPPAPRPVPVFKPALTVPAEIRRPKVEQAEVTPPKLNNFPQAVAPPVVKPGGAMPALIHTGTFSGSSATPTINRPVQQVQTGGFGDPNGLKGEGKPGAHLVTAQVGSFELPQGPGYGNGAGGAKGVKGTIASAGFGNGIASPGVGDGRSSGRGVVQSAGFGSAQPTGPVSPRARPVEAPAPTTPVEILSKPNPVYTEEARKMRLEGEVLLEILFTSDGRIQVQRVVRGLGFGLDEAAISAANRIRFKPAQRSGQPVDSTAIVHVVFQLAY
jgi:TonB family protein